MTRAIFKSSRGASVNLRNRLIACAVCWLAVMACSDTTLAQGRQDGPPRGQRDRANRPDQDRPERGHGDRPPRDLGRGLGPFPLGLPLPPSPEDEGPLRPGEVEELLEFARQKMPDMYRVMKRMRDRNPAEFDQRFEPRAPRVRFLKRIFERNPRLGNLIARHALNQKDIIEARNRLVRRPKAPPDRPAVQYIRAHVANSVRGEVEIFRELAQMLADNREGEIDRWVERMLAPDFDPLAQPPRFRDLLDDIRAANDDARPALEARLREQVAQRIDEVIHGLRRRADRMSANEREEVDERLRRILEGGPPGPVHAAPGGRPPEETQTEGRDDPNDEGP